MRNVPQQRPTGTAAAMAWFPEREWRRALPSVCLRGGSPRLRARWWQLVGIFAGLGCLLLSGLFAMPLLTSLVGRVVQALDRRGRIVQVGVQAFRGGVLIFRRSAGVEVVTRCTGSAVHEGGNPRAARRLRTPGTVCAARRRALATGGSGPADAHLQQQRRTTTVCVPESRRSHLERRLR